MKYTLLLVVAFLAASFVSGAPTTNDEDQIIITTDFFPDELSVYSSQNDIISITVPLNSINFEDDDDDDDSDSDIILFFVEADLDNGEVKEYKGLYRYKNGTATKMLDDGTSSTASIDDSKLAFFGAKSGIYVYDNEDGSVKKYGTVDDSVIDIVKVNGTGPLYVLTEDHTVYKVTEEGNKKVAVDGAKDAQQIMLDYSDNVYFYGPDKKPKVVTENGVQEIVGLPENPAQVRLIKPPFVIENGVVFIVDNDIYTIFANGTSEKTDFKLDAKPTASAVEATLIQYYAYNKNIYEYNILTIILGELFDELKTFLEEKAEDIQSIATRSRSGFRA